MKNIKIILVNPQLGENIGGAARSIMNFGISDLRIVAPRDGWPNQKAIDMAAGAFDYMPSPAIHADLASALADCHVSFATTARTRDMVKPVHTPSSAAIEALEKQAGGQNIAFVFGAERSGLSNDDVALCQNLIHIPTNPNFSSLNLAQAVLLISYELHRVFEGHEEVSTLSTGESAPVAQAELNDFFDRLEAQLDAARFFRSDGLKPTMIRNIRNIFTRNNLTSQEVKTLHGIVSALIGNKTRS